MNSLAIRTIRVFEHEFNYKGRDSHAIRISRYPVQWRSVYFECVKCKSKLKIISTFTAKKAVAIDITPGMFRYHKIDGKWHQYSSDSYREDLPPSCYDVLMHKALR